jgi:non-homologous end joining protein Ku
MSTLYFARDVAVEPELDDVAVDKEELKLARDVIASRMGKWQPETLVDEQEDALRRLLEDKLRGEDFIAPDVANTNVV